MAKEIERKFLVNDDSYKLLATEKHEIVQGYISTAKEATVRVRLIDDIAYLTVKGKNRGCVRNEWEYPIPVDEAREMLETLGCETKVSKVRHIVPFAGNVWEVDEFNGNLRGLVVAEIELPAADAEFERPNFVGKEVTDDPRYYNSVLAQSKCPPSE